MKTGIERIAEERQRQIEKEGWTPEHDDDHELGELALAAACYAAQDEHLLVSGRRLVLEERFDKSVEYTDPWPWDEESDKRGKHDRIRQLEIAGALIAAEIDRIQRKQEIPQ